MTMLKGYVVPQPGASDGEYGGFAGVMVVNQAEAKRMGYRYKGNALPSHGGSGATHGFAAYWERNLTSKVPAINGWDPSHSEGFGDVMDTTSLTPNMAPQAAAPISPVAIGIGALVGYWLGNKSLLGAAVGAAAGYKFGPKIQASLPSVSVDIARMSVTEQAMHGMRFGAIPASVLQGAGAVNTGGRTLNTSRQIDFMTATSGSTSANVPSTGSNTPGTSPQQYDIQPEAQWTGTKTPAYVPPGMEEGSPGGVPMGAIALGVGALLIAAKVLK